MSEPEQIVRLTYDGGLIIAPFGTDKCVATVGGKRHHSDYIHRLFAAGNPGPMVQLMTRCGGRAHEFVLESEGLEVNCPKCLGLEGEE